MFPYDYDPPSLGPQLTLRIQITLDVPSELRCPPLPVFLGQGPVHRAGVPIAASDFHNDTSMSEHKVVTPARPGEDRSVQPVAQTASV